MMVARPQIELGLVVEVPLDELDVQPFGIIRLDRVGTVLSFNTYEERLAKKKRGDVLGLNFFQDIAPCTRVKAFQGRLEEAVARGSMNVTFGFVFPFDHGTRHVDVSLFYKQADDTILGDHPGRLAVPTPRLAARAFCALAPNG